jgi:hypothetical protein
VVETVLDVQHAQELAVETTSPQVGYVHTGAELSEAELAQICAGGGPKGGSGRSSVVNRINIVNRNINNVRVNVGRRG